MPGIWRNTNVIVLIFGKCFACPNDHWRNLRGDSKVCAGAGRVDGSLGWEVLVNVVRFARLRQLALLALILVCAAPLRVTPAASQVPVVDADDTDADGLPDQWERLGHGPLDPHRHHVTVGHHDLILVAVRRPGLSAAIADEQLRQVRDFYAAIPLANPDGTTGINVIVVPGTELTSADASTDYIAVYP